MFMKFCILLFQDISFNESQDRDRQNKFDYKHGTAFFPTFILSPIIPGMKVLIP